MLARNGSSGSEGCAGGFPGEVGDRKLRDVIERNLFCAGYAGKCFYADEEGQKRDGTIRHGVAYFGGRDKFPFGFT